MRNHNLFPALLKTLAFSIGLSSCSSPTPYKESGNSGPGYRDQKLDDNHYRVGFKGNESTSRETVENYLLYRAAELTLQNGYDHFIVTESTTDVKTRYETTAPIYGYYPFGYNYSRYRFPYYSYGYPWSYGMTVRADRQYEATAYISMHKGPAPDGQDSAYDAAEVKQNLEDKIKRPRT